MDAYALNGDNVRESIVDRPMPSQMGPPSGSIPVPPPLPTDTSAGLF